MHNRIPVDSSVIAAVAYSSEAALDIEFTSRRLEGRVLQPLHQALLSVREARCVIALRPIEMRPAPRAQRPIGRLALGVVAVLPPCPRVHHHRAMDCSGRPSPCSFKSKPRLPYHARIIGLGFLPYSAARSTVDCPASRAAVRVRRRTVAAVESRRTQSAACADRVARRRPRRAPNAGRSHRA